MNAQPNRAERRKQRRAQSHKPRKQLTVNPVHSVLARASTAPMSPDDVAEICLRHHTALESISTGNGSMQDLADLQEMIHLTLAFVENGLANAANEATKETLMQAAPAVQLAADAFANVCQRYRNAQKIGWNGSERRAVYECVEWLDELVRISTRGEMTRALLKAEQIHGAALAECKRAAQ